MTVAFLDFDKAMKLVQDKSYETFLNGVRAWISINGIDATSASVISINQVFSFPVHITEKDLRNFLVLNQHYQSTLLFNVVNLIY